MRAAIVRAHGGPEAIELTTVDDPRPAPGVAVVRVRAVALNHLDIWVRRGVPGAKFPLPMILGSEIAGTVEALPEGASGWSVGDEVLVAPGTSCGRCISCLSGWDPLCGEYGILGATSNGGAAELAAVPVRNLMRKPSKLPFAEAASMPLDFLTAWHMLVARGALRHSGVGPLLEEWRAAPGAGAGDARHHVDVRVVEDRHEASRVHRVEHVDPSVAGHVPSFSANVMRERGRCAPRRQGETLRHARTRHPPRGCGALRRGRPRAVGPRGRLAEVLEGIFHKLLSLDGISRAPQLFDLYRKNVETDMSFDDMAKFLPLAAQLRDNGHIRRFSISGREVSDFINSFGSQVRLPNREAILKIAF